MIGYRLNEMPELRDRLRNLWLQMDNGLLQEIWWDIEETLRVKRKLITVEIRKQNLLDKRLSNVV